MAENEKEIGQTEHPGVVEETDGKKSKGKTVDHTSGEVKPIKLPYYLRNSLRYVFVSLKEGKDLLVAKSKLQVVCANLCRVWDISYSADYLNEYNDGTTLTYEEFLVFVEETLLTKRDSLVGLKEVSKLDNICWIIFIKEHPSPNERVLLDDDALGLWKVFKRIDMGENLVVDREEIAIAYEHFVSAIGTPWTPVLMDNYSRELKWTFWDFLKCLEQHYVKSTPKSVYKEGLDALADKYVAGIVKSGLLTKKGHRVKSMKERWFVLFSHTLEYYTSKGAVEKKGDIGINSLTKVENIPDGKGIKCRFAVYCGDRQVKYEIDASDQRTKNEWITAILSCIDATEGLSPLESKLLERAEEREKRRSLAQEEEQRRIEQEALIKQQIEQLEQLRLEREKTQAQMEEEAAMLEEERRRRAELEAVKAEYERLLAEEKQAREAEEEVRLLQEKILEHEREKRLELERIKALQDKVLISERERREGLEMESKERARVLEEERQKMKELQEAREKAEEALSDAHKKLEEAEEERKKAADAVEAAKKRTRDMKMPAGLARPIQGGGSAIITHRGLGAFHEQDFSKSVLFSSTDVKPAAVNATVIDDKERAIIEQPHLVRPSEKRNEQQ